MIDTVDLVKAKRIFRQALEQGDINGEVVSAKAAGNISILLDIDASPAVRALEPSIMCSIVDSLITDEYSTRVYEEDGEELTLEMYYNGDDE